jgi:hypothetical protein
MAHWQDRPEPRWKEFHFKQPYARGLERLRQEVLGKTDFDPATLWQWGTMQAMALVEVLKEAELSLGESGQKLVYRALRRVGQDVGRQILEGVELPADLPEAEFMSFYATVINRIAYASLEAPRVDSPTQASFEILWCPHQDHYGAFDCRVQRYFVQGMIDAATEVAGRHGFQARFDSTIPSGAPTCHFTLWKPTPAEEAAWDEKTRALEARALRHAAERAVREGLPEGTEPGEG